MGLKEKDLNKKITCVEYKPEIYFDRVSDADIARFKDNEKKLAVKISGIKMKYEIENNISSTKAYEEIEEKCQISVTALKYATSCTKGHTANRRFLYKFTVGLGMRLEEADELFELENGKLRDDCLEDLICMCALRDEDDIYDFIEEYEEHTGIKLSMRERKTNKNGHNLAPEK